MLYNGMASTSSWAALYFIALMTFGNYVLFNLLVAILVEGFQAEVTPCPQQSGSRRNRLAGLSHSDRGGLAERPGWGNWGWKGPAPQPWGDRVVVVDPWVY